MRHRVDTRKLGRTASHRVAMYRNMVTSLLQHEQVETTHAKARELRRIADRMITLGKRGGLHARRRAMRVVRERSVAAKLFGELAERYADRPGGYTRVLRTRQRVGDAAEMAVVQLVEGSASARAAEAAPAKKKGRRAKKEEAAEAAPAKKSSKKKSSAKKAPAKKSPAKKTSAKKSATKKASSAKTTGKKKSTRKKKSSSKAD